MGCGGSSRPSELLDGSATPDTVDHDAPVSDLAGAQPDQQAPDLPVPDLQLPDIHVLNDTGTCSPPSYPSDCSQVPSFQCGFGVSCVNGTTLKADWHEHVFCPGYDMEQYMPSYSCTYTCPKGCKSGYTGWPSNGALLVKDACNP